MKISLLILTSLCSSVCLAQAAGTDASAASLPAPAKRSDVVARAEQLVQPSTASQLQLPDGVRNPFVASAFESKDSHLARPTTDKELLVLLAEQLQPTGVMGREDSMVLLLKGQKGVKVNEKLTVSFDGASYEVEVTAIDRYNFSLRYNQAEVTRPIKTGKSL